MSLPAELFIGLMSGTSLDGIDAVLVRFDGDQPQLVSALSTSFDPALRQLLLDLCQPGPDEIDRMGVADRALGMALADAVRQLLKHAGVSAAMVRAIGSHGQTIRHRPAGQHGFTLQIGDAATLAELTGITTVADFRRRDIAAGGQGAPLVPAFHRAVFGGQQARAVVNIGGMANVSLIDSDALLGFDTGPGNVLLDAWAARHLGQPFDADGAWAGSGRVDSALLTRLFGDPFFALPPPKSTGRERFNLQWLLTQLDPAANLSAADVQSSLSELTAVSIAQAIVSAPLAVTEIYVCGGGAYNSDLMRRLTDHLAPLPVATTDRLGLAPEWVEAVAFAWLARQTLAGRPGNAPSVTGAAAPRILGAIHPAS